MMAALEMQNAPLDANGLVALNAGFEGLEPSAILRACIDTHFAGRIGIVSSFGAESIVLLHLVAQIDPTVPVIFLNTGKLFGETLRYRDRLQQALGLTDIRSVAPHPDDLRKKTRKARCGRAIRMAAAIFAKCCRRRVPLPVLMR